MTTNSHKEDNHKSSAEKCSKPTTHKSEKNVKCNTSTDHSMSEKQCCSSKENHKEKH